MASQRMRRASGKSTAPAADAKSSSSSRLSPAQAFAQGVKANWKLVGGIVLGAAVLITLLVLALMPNRRKEAIENAFLQGERALSAAETGMRDRDPEAVKAALERAAAALHPVPKDDPELVARCKEQQDKAIAFTLRLDELRQDQLVELRGRDLAARIAKVGDPASDPAKLLADIDAYLANPLDPGLGKRPDLEARYRIATNEVRTRRAQVDAEITRRQGAATDVPVREARLRCDALIRDERFQQAIEMLNEAAAKHPQADFGPLKVAVMDAAEAAWKQVTVLVDNRLADAANPTMSVPERARTKESARARVQGVIDTWGLPRYVEQARTLLARCQ